MSGRSDEVTKIPLAQAPIEVPKEQGCATAKHNGWSSAEDGHPPDRRSDDLGNALRHFSRTDVEADKAETLYAFREALQTYIQLLARN